MIAREIVVLLLCEAILIVHGDDSFKCKAVKETVNGETITWNIALQSVEGPPGHYLSNAICLDATFNYLTRKCVDSAFVEPYPVCQQVQKAIKANTCPDGLTAYNNKLCYQVLEKAPHVQSCPYPNEESITDLKDLLKDLKIDRLWYPAGRYEPYGYTYFLHNEPTSNYQTIVKDINHQKELMTEFNCLAVDKNFKIYTEKCDENYNRLCAYTNLQLQEYSMCVQIDSTCRLSHYDPNSAKCFCLRDKLLDCELAEIPGPFQNFIFSGSYRIGIVFNEDTEKYEWSNSKDPLQYSYWSDSVPVGPSNIVVNTKKGWVPGDIYEHNICQESMTYNTPTIVLEYDENTNQIKGTISNYNNVVKRYKAVYCFTDSDPKYLISQIDIATTTKVFNVMTFYFNFEAINRRGQYWCEVFAHPDSSLVHSNKIFLISYNNYAVNIVYKYDRKKNIVTDSEFVSTKLGNLETYFKNNYKNHIVSVAWVRTNWVRDDDAHVSYVLHLWTDDDTHGNEDEYLELMKLCEYEKLVKNDGNVVQVDVLQSVYYCPTLEVGPENKYRWERTPVGGKATVTCEDRTAAVLSRWCLEDRISGSKWSNVEGSCIKDNVCEVEEQLANNNVKILWDTMISSNAFDSSSYISTPICVNDWFNMVVRTCRDGKFENQPECPQTQREPSICPDGLTEVVNTEKEIFCYQIQPESTYAKSRCKLKDSMPITDLLNTDLLQAIALDKSIWFPVSRKVTNSYGVTYFTYDGNTNHFGQLFEEDLINQEESLKNDCVILENLQLKAVSCIEQYNSLCIYKVDLNDDIICSKFINSQIMWKADFDYRKCYYLDDGIEDCELAEFLEPHQNRFASEVLLTHNKLQIGLELAGDKYRWITTQTYLTYSYWMPIYQEREESVCFTPNMGWRLSKSKDASAKICQKSLAFPKPILELSEDSGNHVLSINDHHSVGVVKCFTDYSIDYMFSEIDIDELETMENVKKYQLMLSDTQSGNIWCSYFPLPNLDVLSTKTKFVGERTNYVFSLEYKIPPDSDPTYPQYIQTNLLDFFQNTIEESGNGDKYMLAKISSIDTSKSIMSCVIHILLNSEISYNEDEIVLIETQLNDNPKDDIISISRLLSSQYCREEFAYERSWEAVKIGETSEIKCSESSQLTLSRICEGDYMHGATWSTISGTCVPNVCYEEEFVNGETIKWDFQTTDKDPNFSVYISTPICIDENFNYVTRKCREGSFIDVEPCKYVQRELQHCPDDLLELPTGDICYTLTEPIAYPPKCPFSDMIPFEEIPHVIIEDLNEAVWYPAISYDTRIGYSYFVFDEKNYNYKQIAPQVQISDDYKSKRTCSVIDKSSKITAEDCAVKHPGLCVYKTLNNEKKPPFCDGCIQSDYELDQAKCFCFESKENNNCQLAELQKPYQNSLSKTIGPVQIGLCYKNNRRDVPVWCSQGDSLKYSIWSYQISHLYAGDWYLHESGWSTMRSTRKLCQTDFTLLEPEIELNMVRHVDFLEFYVIVRHYQSSLEIDGKFAICFSDASPDELYNIESISLTKKDDADIHYVFKVWSSSPGHYWCETFAYSDHKTISSDVIIFDQYNNYVFTVLAEYTSGIDPAQPDFANNILNELQPLFDDNQVEVRWMRVLEITDEDRSVSHLLHLRTWTEDSCEDELDNYNDVLQNYEPSPHILSISLLKSSKFCPSDSAAPGWGLTEVGKTVSANCPCLQENGDPVTRKCDGDFLNGAQWLPVEGECFDNGIIECSGITHDLHDVLNSNGSWRENLKDLNLISQRFDEYAAHDVFLTAKILNKHHIETSNKLWKEVVGVMDNVMSVGRHVMASSQEKFSATDMILYEFDEILGSGLIKGCKDVEQKENIITFVFDAKTSPVSGIAVFESDGIISYDLLHRKMRNEDFHDLINASLLIATKIPDSVLGQVKGLIPITIYLKDTLFNDHDVTKAILSKSAGIILPKIPNPYAEPVPVIFRRTEYNNTLEESCAFWKYSETVKGEWASDGGRLPVYDDFIRCDFMHTTHFAFLVIRDMTDYDKLIWDNSQFVQVLSTINCILSLLGTAGIFLTALMFRTWRRNKGNQVLLHLSGVTFLQISCIYISGEVKTSDVENLVCMAIGIFLHYAVVSQFCWMMVVAYLQYKRYVQVFRYDYKYTVLKSSAVGYLLPILPIGLLIHFDESSYQQSSVAICYPSGDGLIYALFIPIGIIVTINMLIFSVIIWNVFFPKSKAKGKNIDVEMYFLRFRLVVLLFFMLGMTWIFGFLGLFFNSWMFIYLFSLLSSGQGFVLFLFFIIFNKRVRMMYYYACTRRNKC